MVSDLSITSDKADIGKGLETEEAKKRLAEYGYNEVPEKRTNSLITIAKCLGYCSVDA
jgi:magnesium-transporting ATPase (P-type)